MTDRATRLCEFIEAAVDPVVRGSVLVERADDHAHNGVAVALRHDDHAGGPVDLEIHLSSDQADAPDRRELARMIQTTAASARNRGA